LLPKNRRVRSQSDWKNAFIHKKHRFSCPFFTLLLTPNQLTDFRFGCSISKKHLLKATKRNRFKRIVRHWFQQISFANNNAAFDVILISKPALSKATMQQIKHQLQKATIFLNNKAC